MSVQVAQLLQQHPEVAQALQLHKQMRTGGQPNGGQPPQGQSPQPQQGPPQMPKIPTPPDIQEREIILNAMAKHLQVLDSVITAKTQQPKQPPQQPQMAQALGLPQGGQPQPQSPGGGLPNVG